MTRRWFRVPSGVLGWVLLPGGVYLLLEWAFAFVSETDGLVTPRGAPNAGVIALGIAYLGIRFFVRGVVPMVVAFLLARGGAQCAHVYSGRSRRNPSPSARL